MTDRPAAGFAAGKKVSCLDVPAKGKRPAAACHSDAAQQFLSPEPV